MLFFQDCNEKYVKVNEGYFAQCKMIDSNCLTSEKCQLCLARVQFVLWKGESRDVALLKKKGGLGITADLGFSL